ncbi:MAG: DUF4928 family protein [Planctomycetota bacterium]|jgi:hypothetical protein
MMNPKAKSPVDLVWGALSIAGFGTQLQKDRLRFTHELQLFLARTLDGCRILKPISFEFDAVKPVRFLIGEILDKARQRNQSGPVAQHLVGAKLAIRFPNMEITNFPYSAADDQAGRPGDFYIGDTAFHVTVAPNMHHVARCAQNLREGLSAVLLVPDAKLNAARVLLETENIEAQVAAESVESFVGQNLSELAEFTTNKFSRKMGALLAEYNRRVAAVETDDSLQIVIPTSLRD